MQVRIFFVAVLAVFCSTPLLAINSVDRRNYQQRFVDANNIAKQKLRNSPYRLRKVQNNFTHRELVKPSNSYLSKVENIENVKNVSYSVSPFAQDIEQKSSNGFTGYETEAYGLNINSETRVNKDIIIGIEYAYSDIKTDFFSNISDDLDIEANSAFFYTKYDNGSAYLDAIIGYSFNDYDTRRFSTISSATAIGSFGGEQLSVKIGGGVRLLTDNGFVFIPNSSLEYILLNLGGYTETGAGIDNLAFSDESSERLVMKIGAKIQYPFETNDINITPEARFNWLHNFIDEDEENSPLFVRTSDNQFGPKFSNNAFNIGASVIVGPLGLFDLYADYDYETDEEGDLTAHTGLLRAKLGF